MRKVVRQTYSVCPVCLDRIPAEHATYGDGRIYLEKTCPVHGGFSAIIWHGLRDAAAWRGDLPMIGPGENENCPHACGLCPDHRQGTCCVLLEVTRRCNLRCSFCFAEGGSGEDIPLATVRENLYELAVPGKTLVQLSGGEPTVRDDLPQIVAAAKEAGCRYVQLNTNGVRLGEDLGYVQQLAEAGLSFVFMQFDGTNDEIYRALRGRDLLEIKQKAIENCGRYNLGVTLVPTIVPQINTQDIGNILRFAVSQAPAVRGVHYQPVSYFGRIPSPPSDSQRFTLDELLDAIEKQAGTLVPRDTLRPSRCDHPMCGFHGDYIAMHDQTLHPLRKATSVADEPATADQNRAFVARRWLRPEAGTEDIAGSARQEEPVHQEELETLEGFLRRVRSHSFTVTSMAFQDAGNLDLERLRRCSLHVFDNGKLVPFCAYYLTKHG
ncbi:MAG: radical SAM protein [Peptococcaceae bacterium]|nr:radical SAM protein [Candidatus Syntrophopropionicum ammoniitolerans]